MVPGVGSHRRWGREPQLILLLAVFAGLRVLVYASSFPFFANIDEHMHVDAVLKYAGGYLPNPGNDAYESEMVNYLALYGSREYLLRDDPNSPSPAVPPPPVWERPSGALAGQIDVIAEFLARRNNLEAHQPPGYYLVAGAWMRLGSVLGLEGGRLLYFTRGLSALLFACFITLVWYFLEELYPDDRLMRIGVPLLIAAFPQDALYYISPDAVSPVIVGSGFFLAVRLARGLPGGPGVYALTGLAAGFALFSKYTNVPLFAVLAVCSVLVLANRSEPRPTRGELGRLLLVWGAALALPVWWATRNLLVFGNITNTGEKIAKMGWALKPKELVFDHPLFSISGSSDFVFDLLANFWRGELAWHRHGMSWDWLDGFYVGSSLLLLGLAALALWRREPRAGREVEAMALGIIGVGVATLATLSLLYDFTDVSVPSAARPYFTQGRLLSSLIAPFALVYVRGIQVSANVVPQPWRSRLAWCVLLLIVFMSLGSEIVLSRDVFGSAYNLLHLP